jgi:hypothetical protein
MARIKCVQCGVENDPVQTAGYCEGCGKKLPASTSLVPSAPPAPPDSPKPEASPSWEIQKARRRASRTLFLAAVVQLICLFPAMALVRLNGQDVRNTGPIVLVAALEYVGPAVLFIVLGVWARYQPLIPAIIALVVYLGVNVVSAIDLPMFTMSVGGLIWVFKGIIALELASTVYRSVRVQ